MEGRKNQRGGIRKYSAALKHEIVRDYLSGDLSYGQVAEKYSLKNKGVVQMFVREYRENPDFGFMPASQIPMNETEKAEREALQKRIKELEKQLEEANLRAFAFDMMIDIAEHELGIEIRKKSGAKQSKK